MIFPISRSLARRAFRADYSHALHLGDIQRLEFFPLDFVGAFTIACELGDAFFGK